MVFFICIYVVALNNRIYVSVTYVLCLYECSSVILLTTCGCNTIVSTIEHTFVFTMKTTTGFHQCHSTIRYNHRIISIKLIYLRSTVVLVYGVHKYTTVDVNAPYKRFEYIVVVIFCYYICGIRHGFFHLYIFICICPRYFIYVYIHISHPYFYMYMCSYIDTYICFFKALHIDRTHVRHDLPDRHL